MITKFYNLQKWDKAKYGDSILTFSHMDWAYAKWINEKWEMETGHDYEYELKDWIYYPVTK